MRARTRAMVAAAFTSVALVASACGGGGTSSPGTGEGGGQAGGEIRIRGCTPKVGLVPGNTSETCGGDMIDAMTAKLVHYETKTAAPENDIAESITPSDGSKKFTVKLKPYKFQDGTDVKAKNFVDAWNYTAAGASGQAGSYFFSPFKGYADVQCGTTPAGDADCKGKPAKTEKMSGLKVVDDTTFTIETTEPVSNLPVRLGYSAFAPLPDSFFKDPKAFEDKPIGAGPFKLDSKSTTEYVFSKFADYSGTHKPSIDKVTFAIYTDSSTAYNDVVANNLDYTNEIPTDQLIGEAYKSDLTDRNTERASGGISWITFMPEDPQLKDPAVRKAISQAIDRDTIVKQIFQGTREPATGWVSPVVDGYKADACGASCKYDAAAAKQAFDAAGGYKGTLTLTYNGDADHKGWTEATCNSIANALKIKCVAVPTVDFATFQKKINANELKGMIRSGWQMDYPSIENFLAPIYSKGAESNWAKYDNATFLSDLTKAAAAPSVDEANTLYQKAEAQLSTDFPTAPLWYGKAIVGWSDKVTDVQIDAFGVVDLTSIKMK